MPITKAKRKSPVGKYTPGSTHDTPAGPIVILERLPREEGRHPRAVIRFTETGYVANVQIANISSGKIADKRRRTVYGVGYLDTDIKIPARGTSYIRRVYDLWSNVLRRSYGGYDGSYDGVTVDPRWHSFRVFLDTLPDVPGHDLFEAGENVHLDKDILVPGNKVYSRDTCAFVPAFVNIQDSANRRWGSK